MKYLQNYSKYNEGLNIKEFDISNKEELIKYYQNNIKELEKQLLKYFETGKGLSDFYINSYINANEKQIKTLENVKNNISVLDKNLKVGKNISDKKEVNVYEYGNNYVIKEGVILSQEIPALNIKNPPNNVHIVKEVGIKNGVPVTVMTKALGKPLKKGEKVELSNDNKMQLFKDVLFLEKNNIHVDPSKANNFYYDENTGVHFIDLKTDASFPVSDEFLKYYFTDNVHREYQEWKAKYSESTNNNYEITPEQKHATEQ